MTMGQLTLTRGSVDDDRDHWMTGQMTMTMGQVKLTCRGSVDDDRGGRTPSEPDGAQGVDQGSADGARGVRHHQVVEDDQSQHDAHRHRHVSQVRRRAAFSSSLVLR